MKFTKIALAVSTLLVSGGALAHGFISEPASRDTLCQKGLNKDCGGAQWEPQSVGESPKGFPAAGLPPDGKLVSGNGASERLGATLNIQTADKWYKHKMHAGKNDFTWHFTARHRTASYKYFITKQNWNPNQPLTRASFELTPFCVVPGFNELPPAADVTHNCNVPERSGYQVIYASWEVADTANSFYKVIDVEFDGSAVAPEWSQSIGTIAPHQNLKAGDRVKTRVFDGKGERPDLSTELKITSDAAGSQAIWSKALAEKINAESDVIRAGMKNNAGEVNPVEGVNTLYTRANSGLMRVEIEILPKEEEAARPATINLSNIQKGYVISDAKAHVTFDLTADREMAVNAKVFDQNNTLLGLTSVIGSDRRQSVDVLVMPVKAGKYTLVVTGQPKDHTAPVQQSASVTLTSPATQPGNKDYSFSFPQGLGKYQPGTRVLQPKNNMIYECKPAPFSGWCNIYKTSASQYEPGVGPFWQNAWTEVGSAQ